VGVEKDNPSKVGLKRSEGFPLHYVPGSEEKRPQRRHEILFALRSRGEKKKRDEGGEINSNATSDLPYPVAIVGLIYPLSRQRGCGGIILNW